MTLYFYPRAEKHAERNDAIRAAYERRQGERNLLGNLGNEFGLSNARIHQIVNGRNREPKRSQ